MQELVVSAVDDASVRHQPTLRTHAWRYPASSALPVQMYLEQALQASYALAQFGDVLLHLGTETGSVSPDRGKLCPNVGLEPPSLRYYPRHHRQQRCCQDSPGVSVQPASSCAEEPGPVFAIQPAILGSLLVRRLAWALIPLAAALPTAGQDAPNRVDRFQLFNECRPMGLAVESQPEKASRIGLKKDAIRAAAESRLRAARL